jgi:hypothetical protein
LPKLGLTIVKVAVPVPVTDPIIAVPPSTLKYTLPVGMRSGVELTVTVTVPFAPYAIAGALIDIVVGAGFTVKLPVFELAPKLPCAVKDALKVWLPTVGLVIVNDAEPLLNAFVVAAPLSTIKETLPVTASDPEVTVTVTVPFPLYVVAGALIDVVVAAWFTVCVRTDDVDPAKFAFPV